MAHHCIFAHRSLLGLLSGLDMLLVGLRGPEFSDHGNRDKMILVSSLTLRDSDHIPTHFLGSIPSGLLRSWTFRRLLLSRLSTALEMLPSHCDRWQWGFGLLPLSDRGWKLEEFMFGFRATKFLSAWRQHPYFKQTSSHKEGLLLNSWWSKMSLIFGD